MLAQDVANLKIATNDPLSNNPQELLCGIRSWFDASSGDTTWT